MKTTAHEGRDRMDRFHAVGNDGGTFKTGSSGGAISRPTTQPTDNPLKPAELFQHSQIQAGYDKLLKSKIDPNDAGKSVALARTDDTSAEMLRLMPVGRKQHVLGYDRPTI